jgi:hypothetical protein
MRKTVQVAVLMLVLSASAYAGDMQFPVIGTPPPVPVVQEQTTGGEMNKGTAESLRQIVLELLAALPSLL